MQFRLLKLTLGFLALLAWNLPANAISLEEAGVEKGEAEVEYEGAYTDDNGEGVFEHEHEFEAWIGLLDWLKIGAAIGFEEEEDERDFEFSEIEASATIELIDPEKGGFGLAIFGRVAREFAPDSEDDDEPDVSTFAIGGIAEQHWGKWLVRGNLFYVTDITEDEEVDFDGVEYAYQLRYQFSEQIGLGVEGYGEHLSVDGDEEEDVDTHMVGPVIYISRELGERHEAPSMKDDDDEDGDDDEEGLELEASLGVLFGTNDETADVTVKWNLDLEF